MKRRVVVTGIGLVTPVGATTDESWRSVIAGQSGIRRLTDDALVNYQPIAAGLATAATAQIDALFSLKEQQRADRFIQLGVVAAEQAMHQSGLLATSYDATRGGVYFGVSIGGVHSIIEGAETVRTKGMNRVSPYLIPKLISNEVASHISIRYHFQGPALSVSTACSSGADAIGHAFRAIQSGWCDYMVAGGTESVINPTTIAGFGNMRALSSWAGDPANASRPFDKTRSGFVIAEGAGALVLESYEYARARKASILGELVGYGATADAFHTTAIHPEGCGAQRAMEQALFQAECSKEEIGYINAHGTATQMNDVIEAQVIQNVFGKHQPLVSSTKSMTGHMLGAAGAVEAGFTVLALHNQIAPPTRNLTNPDPRCDLAHVISATSFTKRYALSNSFGFGGSNVVLAFKRSY